MKLEIDQTNRIQGAAFQQLVNQALAAEYVSSGALRRQVPRIIDLYRPKQEHMMRALAEDLPDGFRWSRPDGGMFVWVEGPDGMDIDVVYKESVARGAAFVPGKYFFTNPERGHQTMRLNFTTATSDQLSRAIATIGAVIEEQLGDV